MTLRIKYYTWYKLGNIFLNRTEYIGAKLLKQKLLLKSLRNRDFSTNLKNLKSFSAQTCLRYSTQISNQGGQEFFPTTFSPKLALEIPQENILNLSQNKISCFVLVRLWQNFQKRSIVSQRCKIVWHMWLEIKTQIF